MRNLLFGVIIIFGLLTSCMSSKRAYESPYRSSESDVRSGFQNDIDKKIIYTSYITLIAKNVDTTSQAIQTIAKKNGGYVQSVGTRSVSIRVISDSLTKALKQIEQLGKIEFKNIYGQDVTEEYADYEIRLQNAEKSRARYLELLVKAQNVDETLKVEKELERLNGEIELLKGKMNRTQHLVTYSTISVDVKEKVKPGILGYVFIGVYKTVKWLFVRN